jgi:phage anti-repressor protein
MSENSIRILKRDGRDCVDARELHAALGVGTFFTNWIKGRIEQYGFVAGQDFNIFDLPKFANQKTHGGDRKSKLYAVTLDMAKELAMIENNERGRAIRKYFIAVEQQARLGGEAAQIYGRFSNCPDLTLQKLNKFLYCLSAEPPLSQSDIAKILDVSNATICFWIRVVSRDEAKSVVTSYGINSLGAATKFSTINKLLKGCAA